MSETESTTTSVRRPQLKERRVVIIGKFGVGKTSLLKALLGEVIGGYTGWRDGNGNCNDTHYFVDFFLKLFDTKGLRGNLKHDWPILVKLVQDLMADTSKIDCVFLVLSSNRFSPAEESILRMIREMTSKEFQAAIQIVITHCPERRINEEFKSDIQENLSFLASPSENIMDRVHFVDLIHPHSFEEGSPALEDAKRKWAVAQQKMHQVMLKADHQVPVSKILSQTQLQQFYYVYHHEIWFGIVVLLLGIAMLLLYWAMGMNKEQLEVYNKCTMEVRRLQSRTIFGMAIDRMGDAFHLLKNGIRIPWTQTK